MTDVVKDGCEFLDELTPEQLEDLIASEQEVIEEKQRVIAAAKRRLGVR